MSIKQKNYYKLKNIKGITLIALIITIIILLILVGVTMAQLTENGLFEKTMIAKEKTQNAKEKEDETLVEYENKIGEYINGTTRENDLNSSSKITVLFDCTTDTNGPIVISGATDGTSERTFVDNVNNYDMLLVYFGSTSNSDSIFSPNIIHKSDFNKTITYYIGGFSSNVEYAQGYIKIDTENSKIIYEWKGHNLHQIVKVIGIKI